MSGFRLEGFDLERLAAAYREAEPQLRRQLRRTLATEARPLALHVREDGSSRLPRRGGLAARVARSRIGTSLGTSSRNPSVAIRLSSPEKYDLRRMNTGRLRHPVYARRNRVRGAWVWVTQPIERDVFTRPFEEGAALTRLAVVRAMQGVLDQIPRKI